jgi:L-asparaginase
MPKVLIIYTGGTFGMVPSEGGFAIDDISAKALKQRIETFVPELRYLAHCDIEVALNCDSAHIGPEEWIQLANLIKKKSSQYDGVVVLHGTDTLSYTASALSFLLRPCKKPVIITGAQRPLASIRTDARRNLLSAVEIAATGPRDVVSQVCVFFDDRLLQGNLTRKRSATDFFCF